MAHIKIARRFFRDDPFWNEPREFSRAEAWLDILQMAAWTKAELRVNTGERRTLLRGQFSASLRFLATRWNWSKSKGQRFIETLVRMDRVTPLRQDRLPIRSPIRAPGQDAGHLAHVYVVENYDTYQGVPQKRGTLGGTVSGTSNGTRTGTKDKQVKQGEAVNNKKRTTTRDARSIEQPRAIPARAVAEEVQSLWAEIDQTASLSAPSARVALTPP